MGDFATGLKDSLEVVAPYLQELGSMVGNAGGYVFQLQVKQVYITSILNLILPLLMIVLWLQVYKHRAWFFGYKELKIAELKRAEDIFIAKSEAIAVSFRDELKSSYGSKEYEMTRELTNEMAEAANEVLSFKKEISQNIDDCLQIACLVALVIATIYSFCGIIDHLTNLLNPEYKALMTLYNLVKGGN